MGKLYLYYKRHNDSQFGEVMKLKVDNDATAEVKKNDIYEMELPDGVHNLKMYYEGWSNDELIGYIDQDVEIKGDTYYIYKAPVTIYGKGELVRNNANSVDEFKKYVSKTNVLYKVLGAIVFVVVVLILIFL